MKRTGFKRKIYTPPPPAPPTRGSGGTMAVIDQVARPVAKDPSLVSETYRRLVRAMPCMHCRIVGFTQFCHSDQGKGMSMKTDDRRGWPGCGPHGDDPGCHHLLGSTGKMPRQQRRDFEDEYSARTRAEIRSGGLWPPDLPLWPGDLDQQPGACDEPQSPSQ